MVFQLNTKKIIAIAFVSVFLLSTLGAYSITPVVAGEPDYAPVEYPALTAVMNDSALQGGWSFDLPEEWGNFAFIDDDSAELVIGLSNTQPSVYADLKGLIMGKGGEVVDTVSMGSEHRAVLADIPFEAVSSFVKEVEAAGLSSYIEPNFKVQVTFVPNDPNWTVQWGPKKIEADYAWNTTTGSPSVLVAVIDTGIDYNHSDLAANYVPLGYDWVNNDNDPMDDHGHGTHCAGIIAAELNNSIGIAGLAQVQIMAEKVIDELGSGSIFTAYQGISHAVNQSADILSLSLGCYYKSEELHNAVKYAYNNGVLVVAAAGNEAIRSKLYPAGFDEVIAVTATNESDDPASFTNFGSWVELAAPGVKIYSTMPTYDVRLNFEPYYKSHNYDNLSGTSMACPHVAGVAALIWSRFPTMTRDQARVQLWYTADDLDSGFDQYYGYGRVNARRAVEEAQTRYDFLIYDWDILPALEPGNTMIVNTTVLNFGTSDWPWTPPPPPPPPPIGPSIEVQLLVNGSVKDLKKIYFLKSGALSTVSFSWTPTVEGVYNVTTYVVPVPGETVMKYNARSRYVRVKVGKFFTVPTDFETIQDALDSAPPGYSIYVESGRYIELLTIENNETKLIGENRSTTIIDGYGTDSPLGIVYVAPGVRDVEITGFTIQNASLDGTSGIFLGGDSSNVNITDNIVTNTTNGIWVGDLSASSSSNIIIGNTVTSNSWTGITLLFYCSNNIVSDNIVTLNGYVGIVLMAVADNNIISDNTLTSNNMTPGGWGGIALLGADYNNVSGNTITLHGNDSCMDGNFITLQGSNGIWVEWSDGNVIRENNVKNNYRGIGLYKSNNNKIYHNNFINNTEQLYNNQSSNQWTDRWECEGNYWSDYNGADSNRTKCSLGIGDNYLPWLGVDEHPLMAPYVPGDINHDGHVNVLDLGIMGLAWNSSAPPPPDPKWDPHADLNEDGVIDEEDLEILGEHWLKGAYDDGIDPPGPINFESAWKFILYLRSTGQLYNWLINKLGGRY